MLLSPYKFILALFECKVSLKFIDIRWLHLKLNIPTIFTRVSYRVAPGRPAICAVYWLQHSKTHIWNCLIKTTNTLQETSIYSFSNDISFINFQWNLLSVRCNWKLVVLIFSKFWTVRDDQRGLLLGRGRLDLASCQVSLNSVQWFQRRSRKCLSQSEARAAILFFRSARKTQTW